jgi:type I restriction enzyme M protein
MIFATTCSPSSSCVIVSDNYETAAKKELGKDYPDAGSGSLQVPLALWYAENPSDTGAFETQMRRKVHYAHQT